MEIAWEITWKYLLTPLSLHDFNTKEVIYMSNNPFENNSLGNLVSSTRDMSLESVNQMFKDTYQYGTPAVASAIHPCYICGKESEHRVVSKHKLLSLFIQEKGYICPNCLQTGLLDKKAYGIRPIKK